MPKWDFIPEILDSLAGVGNSVGSIIGAVNGGSQNGNNNQPVLLPEKKQDNTTLWIVGVLGVVLIGGLMVVFFKKKPA